MSIDTKILGVPVVFDSEIVMHGIPVSGNDDLCIGSLRVDKADVYGFSKHVLDLLEAFVFQKELHEWINDMVGDEICL